MKAALDGEVVAVVDTIEENYNDKADPENAHLEDKYMGNFLLIKHQNNEFSEYGHLRYRGVLVEKGQHVKTGELIGLSGHTGLSYKPHLHFQVLIFTKPEPDRDHKTLKIRWKK